MQKWNDNNKRSKMVVLEKGRLGWILATGRISRHKIHWRLIGCFEDLEGCTSWVSMYRDVRLRSARLISPEQNITIEDTRCASSTLRLQLSLLTDFTNDFANNAAGLILLGFGWLVHWFSLFTMHWSFFSSFSFDSLFSDSMFCRSSMKWKGVAEKD